VNGLKYNATKMRLEAIIMNNWPVKKKEPSEV
jgi:hypothetical protein